MGFGLKEGFVLSVEGVENDPDDIVYQFRYSWKTPCIARWTGMKERWKYCYENEFGGNSTNWLEAIQTILAANPYE